ncbi:hypothetical protein [Psychroflexus maritimus]|uniref:Uncharacterized protein n=1 Tax=Psychroflexus maritimus TaxID=2714865 RepID=A0A967AAJ2_9FLAO|nr:hypothetical protein [Psychroflexus maritimus]NGZ88662.1 hypothetical protein [Psychroflexus maritimus]
MNSKEKLLEKATNLFLKDHLKEKIEKVVVYLAIILFIAHLILIGIIDFNLIDSTRFDQLTINPISALYTPFSVILIYEIYLLVFYLPKSITNYIGKQYEIITLILIRKIFYDLAQIEFSEEWFSIQGDLQFTLDILATLVLFFGIFLFYRLDQKNKNKSSMSQKTIKYIQMKKFFAVFLIPVILVLGIFSIYDFITNPNLSPESVSYSIKGFNAVFFDDFFTILIVTDVLLLLFSFLQTNQFSRVIRNSGFIISTVIIKLSFSADGILNPILIVTAVVFGLLILLIYHQFTKLEIKK